jgi:hypothetical protein
MPLISLRAATTVLLVGGLLEVVAAARRDGSVR